MKSVKHSRASSAMSAHSFTSFKLDPSAMIKHTQSLQNYISSKAILQLQEKSDLEVQASNCIVKGILEKEKTIVKENIDNIIREHEINEQRRREVLNNRWNRNIYEPLCEKITQSINGINLDKIIKKKRQIHQDYLDYVNKKDFVSLSEYSPDDYYPYLMISRQSSCQLKPQSHVTPTIRVQSANPTSIDENSRLEEDRCQLRCLTGSILRRKDLLSLRLPQAPLVPLGRQGSDCISWTYMPYGQINSDVRTRSRRKMRGDFNYDTTYLGYANSESPIDSSTLGMVIPIISN